MEVRIGEIPVIGTTRQSLFHNALAARQNLTGDEHGAFPFYFSRFHAGRYLTLQKKTLGEWAVTNIQVIEASEYGNLSIKNN